MTKQEIAKQLLEGKNCDTCNYYHLRRKDCMYRTNGDTTKERTCHMWTSKDFYVPVSV